MRPDSRAASIARFSAEEVVEVDAEESKEESESSSEEDSIESECSTLKRTRGSVLAHTITRNEKQAYRPSASPRE